MDDVLPRFHLGKKSKDVFNDFRGRRAGILRALTTDVDKFFQECDPAKEIMCLYGYPDGNWGVALPSEDVPTSVPEPLTGINVIRDRMPREEWLNIVALRSDSWLLCLSFYLATCCLLNKKYRKKLFNLINDLPTIHEIVTGALKGKKEADVKTIDKGKGNISSFLGLYPCLRRYAHGGSPEYVYQEFTARRAGILKALTTDVEKLFQECDPKKENLCLFGYLDRNWQVAPPSAAPPELPDLVLGINYARGDILRKYWLDLIAANSDAWLLSVSFFFGAYCGFNKESRKKLFNLINDLPTIHDIVIGDSGGFVEYVFQDFKARRAGILKALTTDLHMFFQECNPDKDNLCLYGHPNKTWQVAKPEIAEQEDLPAPAVGINFARDGMSQKNWLTFVAAHSDAWLLYVSFFFGILLGFNKECRMELFTLINELPTIKEIMDRTHIENTNPSGSSMDNKSALKAGSSTKVSGAPPLTQLREQDVKDTNFSKGQASSPMKVSGAPSLTQKREMQKGKNPCPGP